MYGSRELLWLLGMARRRRAIYRRSPPKSLLPPAMNRTIRLLFFPFGCHADMPSKEINVVVVGASSNSSRRAQPRQMDSGAAAAAAVATTTASGSFPAFVDDDHRWIIKERQRRKGNPNMGRISPIFKRMTARSIYIEAHLLLLHFFSFLLGPCSSSPFFSLFPAITMLLLWLI